ncbi:MAG: ATP-binding protein [Candidatus Hodarchaeales archaeon]
MSKTDYPDIPKEVRARLENETGRIVSAIQDPVYVGLDQKFNIKAIVDANKSRVVKLDDVVLIYDYLRGEIIAARVIGHSTQTIDENKTTDKLFKLDNVSGFEKFINKRYDFIRTPHLFHLEPIIKLAYKKGELIAAGSVDFAPSEMASLFPPTGSEVFTIYGMMEKGINIACLGRENELKVFTDQETGDQFALPIKIPKQLFNRHVSFNGTTGSGKTLGLKGILAQLYQEKSGIFLTDTQGDYVAHIIESEISEDQKNAISKDPDVFKLIKKAMGIELPKSVIDPKDLTIWYPPVLDFKDDLVLYYLKKKEKEKGYRLRKFQPSSSLISSWGTLATVLPKLSEVQSMGLSLIFSTYMTYLEEKNELFKLNSFITYLKEKEDQACEIGEINRVSLRPIRRALKTLNEGNILDRVREEESTKYSDLFQEGKISILYLPRDVKNPKIDLEGITPLLQLLIYQLILRNKTQSSFQRVIVLDEAQNIIPNERYAPSKTIARELARQFEILAREGRKNNFSLIVASQEPGRINSTVFKQCATRIFLRLPTQDIEEISREIDRKHQYILPRLKVGSGIIHSPDAIEVGQIWVKFPIPPVFHESIFVTIERIEQSEIGKAFLTDTLSTLSSNIVHEDDEGTSNLEDL